MIFVKKVILSTLLLSIMGVYGQAQEQLYLDENFRLTTEKTAITCVENNNFPREALECYDCYGPDNELKYQLSGEFYVDKTLIAAAYYQPYVKKGERGIYLVGNYKNGKPDNGFFRTTDEMMKEWLLCDFYQNGVRTEQFSNNFFKAIIEGYEDDETSWYALNQKTTYKNDIPENGIKVSTFQVEDAFVQILENISNGKTEDYIIGLFAIHYGEFISIKEIVKGNYEIRSFESNDPVINIIYTDSGKTYRFTRKNDTHKIIELSLYQQKLADFDISELKEREVATYFEKDGEVYVNRQKGDPGLWDEWKRIDTSKALLMLSEFFGQYPPKLCPEYYIDAFTRRYDKYGSMLSSIMRHNGAYFGFKYQPGRKDKTYTLTLFENQNETIFCEDKTIDEISERFKSLMQQQDEI